MAHRLREGMWVRVSEGSGVDSGIVGKIVSWRLVGTDGRGIPRAFVGQKAFGGHYNSPDRKKESVIVTANGYPLIMFNNRLTPVPAGTPSRRDAKLGTWMTLAQIQAGNGNRAKKTGKTLVPILHKAQELRGGTLCGQSGKVLVTTSWDKVTCKKCDQIRDGRWAEKGRRAGATGRRANVGAGIHPAWAYMQQIASQPHYLKRFKDDFFVHDQNSLMAADPKEPFIWIIREGGTHLFFPARVLKGEWDKPQNRVSNLVNSFGPAKRDQSGRTSAGGLYEDEAMDIHLWDGQRIYATPARTDVTKMREYAVAWAKAIEARVAKAGGRRVVAKDRIGVKPAGQSNRIPVYKSIDTLAKAVGGEVTLANLGSGRIYNRKTNTHQNFKFADGSKLAGQASAIADALGGIYKTQAAVSNKLRYAGHKQELWRALGSYADRLTYHTNGVGWMYHAGQDYPAETARIRKIILNS